MRATKVTIFDQREDTWMSPWDLVRNVLHFMAIDHLAQTVQIWEIIPNINLLAQFVLHD